MTKLNTEEFILRAKKIHGDRYDYSKVNYVNAKTKVCIICPKHGEFWQIPSKHITRRQGCRKCADELRASKKRDDTKSFIEKAIAVHGTKYNYSEVHYIDTDTKIKIICPIHGEFWQTPNNHLSGRGCPQCANESVGKRSRDTTESFIKKCKEKYGAKYSYEKVHYVDTITPVIVTCPIHGDFTIKPSNFLQHTECRECKKEKIAKEKRISFEEFVKRAKSIHGEKYTYSYDDYTELRAPTKIICPIHGEFWQTAINHTKKENANGCPKCQESIMERIVRRHLENNSVKYIFQCKFEWLKYKHKQSLDFYLQRKRRESHGIFSSVDEPPC